MANTAMIYTDDGDLKIVEFGDDSLSFLQDSVDGYIDALHVSDFGDDIALWINDEGKFRSDLKPSALLMYKDKPYDYVVGNIVFTGINKDGDTTSLTKKDIAKIKFFFDEAIYFMDFKNGVMIPQMHY